LRRQRLEFPQLGLGNKRPERQGLHRQNEKTCRRDPWKVWVICTLVGKEPLESNSQTICGIHTVRKGFTFTPSRVERPHNTQGIQESPQKGVAFLMRLN
jgi:hypothetical protein